MSTEIKECSNWNETLPKWWIRACPYGITAAYDPGEQTNWDQNQMKDDTSWIVSCCQHLQEVKRAPFAFGGLLLPWLSFAHLNKHFHVVTKWKESKTFSTKATFDLKRGARRSLIANFNFMDEMRHFLHISEDSHTCCIKFQIHDICSFAKGKSTTLKSFGEQNFTPSFLKQLL